MGPGQGVPIPADPRFERLVLLTPATGYFQAPGALDNIHIPIQAWAGTNDTITPPAQREWIECQRASGISIYELHPGGSDSIGVLGYLKAFDEIVSYSEDAGIHFDTIIHATGSTGTQAGLVLGQCVSGYDTRIVGIDEFHLI